MEILYNHCLVRLNLKFNNYKKEGDYMEIGRKIKDLRIAKGLTQEELEARIRIREIGI